MSDYTQITAAYDRIRSSVRKTPLLNSPALDKLAGGRRIWVKAECLQYTGSFKYRGAHSAISALSADERALGVIAFSSGNHAQGVAAAAAAYTISAKIIMPNDAPRIKVENTLNYGAEVIFFDRATQNREQIAAQINAMDQRVLIKPFDNEQVIAGQGTVGLELAQQAQAFGVDDKAQVLVCCGGGGLSAGIALALAHDAPQMRVHPVEPIGFDDVKRSLEKGQIVKNKNASGSICDAIITPAPGHITFPILRTYCAAGITVSDEQALHAMALAFQHLKIIIEPGGAVALAAALFATDQIQTDDVICIASGGNVDTAMFEQALHSLI